MRTISDNVSARELEEKWCTRVYIAKTIFPTTCGSLAKGNCTIDLKVSEMDSLIHLTLMSYILVNIRRTLGAQISNFS